VGIDSAIRTVQAFLSEAKAVRGSEPPLPDEDALLDAGEAAAYLNLSVSWVYKAAERGELPCVRIGSALRFDAQALRKWVQLRSR
jgi:excisionase family DNA binding protein